MGPEDLTPENSEAAQSKREAGKLARQVEANDIKWLMANRQGRRIVRRWLAAAGIYRTSFVANDSHASAYVEGKRAFGLQILGDVVAAAPEDYLTMLSEGTKK